MLSKTFREEALHINILIDWRNDTVAKVLARYTSGA